MTTTIRTHLELPAYEDMTPANRAEHLVYFHATGINTADDCDALVSQWVKTPITAGIWHAEDHAPDGTPTTPHTHLERTS